MDEARVNHTTSNIHQLQSFHRTVAGYHIALLLSCTYLVCLVALLVDKLLYVIAAVESLYFELSTGYDDVSYC